MKRLILILCISASCAMFLPCCKNSAESGTDYSEAGMWCHRPTDCKAPVDVFYVVSTMITKSVNPDGSESYMALLTDEEKQTLASEINHVKKNMVPDSVNYFAPYYHEMTMSSYKALKMEQLKENAGKVKKEVCDAFDYYMANNNNSRPFILVGYSQGAIMVNLLVQHMTDEQYSRMVAAYMVGFGLNDLDLEKPHVKKASGRYDSGSIISWNSVKSPDKIFEPIWSNAVTCMNPVSWKPDDTTRIKYSFETSTATSELTLHVDSTKHVLIVEGFDPAKHPDLPSWETPWDKDNYHDYETYLYCPYVKQNIRDRITAFVR